MAADFCDRGSLPKKSKAAFEKWAAKLVQYPPQGEFKAAFELRHDESLGLHMVARRSVEPDDLVISEQSVLRVPSVSQATKHEMRSRFGSRGQFLMPALAVDWNGVDEDLRQAVMTLFWAHPKYNKRGSQLLEDTRNACQRLLQEHEALREQFGASDLMRFLHIVDLNIHRDNESLNNADFAGLFLLGSKFTHSCEPNCQWSFGPDGCLQYRAIRKIAPGELFTFSYIGKGMNMLEGTIARRRQLASLWFVCQCTRCRSPNGDLARQMRCPRCGESSCLPQAREPEPSKIEWAGEQPVEIIIPDAKEWHCKACSGTIPASQMPGDLEQECEELLPGVFGGEPEEAHMYAQRALELRRRVAGSLGPSHWIFVLATFAWLQKCLTQLQSLNVIQFSDRDLQTASALIARWLRDCTPLNTHQRLSALALTLRLASQLGGDLQSWGYDPSDPLQDGSSKNAMNLLASHGVSVPACVASAAWDHKSDSAELKHISEASPPYQGSWHRVSHQRRS
jgi:hypothetical protein